MQDNPTEDVVGGNKDDILEIYNEKTMVLSRPPACATTDKLDEVLADFLILPKNDVKSQMSSSIQDSNIPLSEKNVIKQQSLEEELLMEEELLKGEDDDADVNLNSDDLILDEDSIMASEPSQKCSPVSKTLIMNVQESSYDGTNLNINIDSLLGTTSGLQDDNIAIEEMELLNESESANFASKDDSNSKMVFDEDSLLKDLDSNVNKEDVSEDNLDYLQDNIMSTATKCLVASNKSEMDLVAGQSDSLMQLVESNMSVMDAKEVSHENSEITIEDNTLFIDSQMTDVDASTPMDENSFSRLKDSPMEESVLLMEDDEIGSDINTTPMEENTLLADNDNSEITIDENNLLDDSVDPNVNDITVIDENILLTDDNTNTELKENFGSGVLEDLLEQEIIKGATSGVEHIDLDDSSKECVNELEAPSAKSKNEDNCKESIEFEIETGIDVIDHNNDCSDVTDVVGSSEAEKENYIVSLAEENIESNSLKDSEAELDCNSELVIEECNPIIEKESDEVDDGLESYKVTDDEEEIAVEEDSQSAILNLENVSVSNSAYCDNDTENLIKEEVLENEFDQDYLTKANEEFPKNSDDLTDYDTLNTVVKEEMADIDTLVDLKQEVLEEADHLALDHGVKQEYLDPDGIKEEYPNDELCSAYYNDDKGLSEVVPVALNKSSEFCAFKADNNEEMIVPASMISAADIINMQDKNMDSKGNEEIIISDKCVDVTKLNNMEMDVETEGDSLLAPRSFACSICHREYLTIASLQRHEKIHANDSGVMESIPVIEDNVEDTSVKNLEGLYKCSCGKGFKRRSCIVACMKTHRVRGIWCEQCGISFRRQRELRTHMLRIHVNGPKMKNIDKPKCTICNKEFAHQRSLARHGKLHLKVDAMEGINEGNEAKSTIKAMCKLCNLEFETDLELGNHTSIAHPLPVVEGYCSTRESRQPSLKLKFNCKTCKKVFLTLGSLASHKLLHSKRSSKMKFVCERCQESFQTRSELSSHRRLHCRGVLHHYSALQYIADRDVVKIPKVKCDVCSETYASKEDMERHRDATHPFVTFSKEDATETRIFFK